MISAKRQWIVIAAFLVMIALLINFAIHSQPNADAASMGSFVMCQYVATHVEAVSLVNKIANKSIVNSITITPVLDTVEDQFNAGNGTYTFHAVIASGYIITIVYQRK